MATDPICGMTVDPKSAAGTHEHNGETYYFCSQHCVTQFKKDPERFVKPAASAHAAAVEQSRGQNESVIDPVCGMNWIRPRCGETRARGRDLSLLQPAMHDEVQQIPTSFSKNRASVTLMCTVHQRAR